MYTNSVDGIYFYDSLDKLSYFFKGVGAQKGKRKEQVMRHGEKEEDALVVCRTW